MLARVEFEGEERVRAGVRAGQGRAVRHRAFRVLGAAGDGARAAARSRWPSLARALDNPRLNALLERIRTAHRQHASIYRQGDDPARDAARCRPGSGVGVLIDQHIMSRDAIYVDFFERPAATTSAVAALALRTGAPVVPVFALPLGARTLSDGVRAPGRAAARRRRRRRARVHAALHRRARDVRAPASGAVAVDAPPVARQRRGGDSVPGLFPPAARDVDVAQVSTESLVVSRVGAVV